MKKRNDKDVNLKDSIWNIIPLSNRYRKDVYLLRSEENYNEFFLECQEDSIRVGFYNEEDTKPTEHSIYFVDPPGGPFISVGNLLPGYETVVVEDIQELKDLGYKIILKENDLPSESESTEE